MCDHVEVSKMTRCFVALLTLVFLAFGQLPALAADWEGLGNVLQFATPAYGLYASARMNGRDGLRACATAVGVTALSTQALKSAIDAPRPNGGTRGFPSGHTSAAAAGFGCLLGQQGWSGATIALGASSVLTAYSRVKAGRHTAGQTAAGFLLGSTVGYFATRHLRPNMALEAGLSSQNQVSLNWRVAF